MRQWVEMLEGLQTHFLKTGYVIIAVLLFYGSLAMADNEAGKRDSSRSQLFPVNQQGIALNSEADQQQQEKIQEQAQRKSGFKAALFSAIVPGGGEVYTGSYWRAALFAGLEIAFWSANIIYNQKGDDEDARMRTFGNEHWSDAKYWAKVYEDAESEGLWDGPALNVDAEGRLQNYEEYYNKLWNLQDDPSLGYTHILPKTKTQQYYEMIYKYLGQFGVGWDDVPYADYYEDNLNHPLTENIRTYRDMRNRSNDYYQTATTMLNLVMMNHLASALDAAWSAKQHNQKYRLSFHIDKQRYDDPKAPYLYGVRIAW